MPNAPLADRLRHRVIVQRGTEVEKPKGGYETTWAPVATLFAEVTGLNGRESVMDKVLQGISVYRIVIRWRGDLEESDQLHSAGPCFRGRPVNIRSVVDPDGRREQLVIIADTASTRES